MTLTIALLLLALARPAQADFVQTFTNGFQNGGVISDGNLTGWTDVRTLSDAPRGPITNVSVTLNLSGGWNGDLYAYLEHDSGFSVLLNRVGRGTDNGAGYGDAGMNVVLNDAASVNLHSYGGGGVPTGSYAPDGRNISPLSSTATFSLTSPSAMLGSFNGGNANGNWTLFIADVSPGDQSTLTSWGLDIGVVPEPASMVLFLGGVVGLYISAKASRLSRGPAKP